MVKYLVFILEYICACTERVIKMPRRGENIYKRKDGRWEARYVKEITADGRKKYGSVYADNYREVKTKQQQYLLQPAKTVCNTDNLTVNALIMEWLASVKNHIKPNTFQKYESVCRNHIVKELGCVSVKLISGYTIINFTNCLKNKKLSSKSINDILIILGSAFRYAEEEYSITMPRIRYLKTEKKDIQILSLNEQLQLTTYLNSNTDIYKFGILLALYTGIRIGELCALQWNDITDDYIQINKTMFRVKADNTKTAVKIGTPKSESSKRIIPTPQGLLPLIDKYRKSGYVLSNHKSDYTEPRLMQIKFEKIITECKLKRITFHALRHTFATRCIEAGVDVKTLSEILGHSDVKTTLNRYVHSSFELKQKSMKQFELSLIS